MKWNNIVTINIVPIFNRGLPKAVPINMHLGFASNITEKFSEKFLHLKMKRKWSTDKISE